MDGRHAYGDLRERGATAWPLVVLGLAAIVLALFVAAFFIHAKPGPATARQDLANLQSQIDRVIDSVAPTATMTGSPIVKGPSSAQCPEGVVRYSVLEAYSSKNEATGGAEAVLDAALRLQHSFAAIDPQVSKSTMAFVARRDHQSVSFSASRKGPAFVVMIDGQCGPS
jgi:hypothetical protein